MIHRPRCSSCGKELSATVVLEYLRELSKQSASLRAKLVEHTTMVRPEEKHVLWGWE